MSPLSFSLSLLFHLGACDSTPPPTFNYLYCLVLSADTSCLRRSFSVRLDTLILLILLYYSERETNYFPIVTLNSLLLIPSYKCSKSIFNQGRRFNNSLVRIRARISLKISFQNFVRIIEESSSKNYLELINVYVIYIYFFL